MFGMFLWILYLNPTSEAAVVGEVQLYKEIMSWRQKHFQFSVMAAVPEMSGPQEKVNNHFSLVAFRKTVFLSSWHEQLGSKIKPVRLVPMAWIVLVLSEVSVSALHLSLSLPKQRDQVDILYKVRTCLNSRTTDSLFAEFIESANVCFLSSGAGSAILLDLDPDVSHDLIS